MANAEYIQELIRSHVAGDDRTFRRAATQLAAAESRAGHRKVAGRIRELLQDPTPPASPLAPTPLLPGARDLDGFVEARHPSERLRDVVLTDSAKASFDRIRREAASADLIRDSGLRTRRRILLAGPPGCGKTIAASALAGELAMPLLRVRLEVLFSRYMGETTARLVEVFVRARRHRGVYLFDEFDAVAKIRGDSNDVGEARRLVSTLLQLMDQDESDSVFIAATNALEVIDRAVVRRFDDIIEFPLPDAAGMAEFLELRLAQFGFADAEISDLCERARGLSFALVGRAIDEALKTMIMDGAETPSLTEIRDYLRQEG